MRILVISATSYVGRHLWACLDGHERIGTFFRNSGALPGPGHFLDIRNPAAVFRLVGQARPDLVYVLAYDPRDLAATIFGGTRNLIRAVESVRPRPRLVFLSTDCVFDGNAPPYPEDARPLTTFFYGWLKARAEDMVLATGHNVVRTSLVYGFDPMDPRTALLVDGLVSGRFAHLYFDDEWRCPIHVQDLCQGLVRTAERPGPAVFHIAGPERLSRLEFARRLARILGFDASKVPGGRSPAASSRPRDITLSTARTVRSLKFAPRSVDETGRSGR